MPKDQDIINVRHFIEATRDSGYKSTTSAIAELVDNSIQANATEILVDIVQSDDDRSAATVRIADNGIGMATAELRQALQFGGTSRFGDRSGLGRYGMGLPNASLSQCRRVEVVSWTSRRNPLFCWIDVDEIAAGRMTQLPSPKRARIPEDFGQWKSGTAVCWLQCDRLDNVRVSTIERKVTAALGRMFRYFIWDGVRILLNGTEVRGLDPLYLHPQSPINGGFLHGKKRSVRVRPTPDSRATGVVTVRFSRLPIEKWSSLPNDQKRAMGVANGAGVSILRAGREIEYGWHFMRTKRRENYDDWWRCEVAFNPCLDEAFGITHTKQQIRPRGHLLDALVPEIESVAKSLNAAVRKDFHSIKATVAHRPLEQSLIQIESKLPPIGRRRANVSDESELEALRDRHAHLRVTPPACNGRAGEYRLVEDARTSKALFDVHADEGRIVVVMNKRHPFYKKAILANQNLEHIPVAEVRMFIEQLIVSAARAEMSLHKTADVQLLRSFRDTWGHTLALLSNE